MNKFLVADKHIFNRIYVCEKENMVFAEYDINFSFKEIKF